mgnify:CR=1 FL=1
MTANTVVAQEKSSVSSLAQALDRGYRFCGWGSTEAYLKLAFPAMAGRFVSMDGGRQMSRAMDDNICDAAIMEDVTWESVQGGESCDRLQKVLLPELIYSRCVTTCSEVSRGQSPSREVPANGCLPSSTLERNSSHHPRANPSR